MPDSLKLRRSTSVWGARLPRRRGTRATQNPVCVLSVGRSGTSLAARALGLHGLHLGDDADMMPASRDNARGYWEHMDVFRLNEAILAHLGGSWFEPPTPEPGWEHDAAMQPFVERARAIAAELGAGGRRWAFKDPRSVVTLPLWVRACGRSTTWSACATPQQ